MVIYLNSTTLWHAVGLFAVRTVNSLRPKVAREWRVNEEPVELVYLLQIDEFHVSLALATLWLDFGVQIHVLNRSERHLKQFVHLLDLMRCISEYESRTIIHHHLRF